jgi:hypothetical protein
VANYHAANPHQGQALRYPNETGDEGSHEIYNNLVSNSESAFEMSCRREYQKLNTTDVGPGTRATAAEGPPLLPDEICLAEDNNILFELYSQQEGFCIFNTRKEIKIRLCVKTYLTNYRVHPNHKLTNS